MNRYYPVYTRNIDGITVAVYSLPFGKCGFKRVRTIHLDTGKLEDMFVDEITPVRSGRVKE